MHQLQVGNVQIDVVRKKIKNLHLGVYPPHGRVRIAAPLQVDDAAVRLFAISKIHWIKQQQSKYLNQDRQSAREFVSGESHYFKGTRYLLNVIYTPSTAKVVIRNKTYMDLYVRENSTREQREKVLTDWYRKHLKAQIPALVDKWQSIMGVEVDSWGVKKMKTKWGSCNIEARRIWVNLDLAKKPERCLEYIVVHEMVHLLERNHNEHFIAYMDRFIPQWRVYKEELTTLLFD